MSAVAAVPSGSSARAIVRGIAVASGILLLVMLTSAGVGLAARRGVLIPAALPFGVVLIGVLRTMGPRIERTAWAVFTFWLGTTYLQTGAGSETGLAVAYLLLGVVGAVRTPWGFVLAWAFHPFWDFLPRTLPAALTDLPTACLLFDVPIALYLGWSTSTGRWNVRSR